MSLNKVVAIRTEAHIGRAGFYFIPGRARAWNTKWRALLSPAFLDKPYPPIVCIVNVDGCSIGRLKHPRSNLDWRASLCSFSSKNNAELTSGYHRPSQLQARSKSRYLSNSSSHTPPPSMRLCSPAHSSGKPPTFESLKQRLPGNIYGYFLSHVYMTPPPRPAPAPNHAWFARSRRHRCRSLSLLAATRRLPILPTLTPTPASISALRRLRLAPAARAACVIVYPTAAAVP